MLAEAIAEPQVRVPSGFPKRKVWTRTECEILAKTGIVDTGKLELIEGDLIERMKNRPRVNAMMLVMEWLVGVFGFRYITSEGPVDVAPDDNPTSEPEPDLAVLEKPRSAYGAVNPKPSDILLLVEVSDTTLTFDRRIKAGLYARAGIVEYWVVDVEGRRIVVHRNPQGGTYTDVKSYGTGESIEPLAAPGKSFPVDSAFAG